MNKIVYIICLCLLPGCLLNQKDPAPVPLKPFLKGIMVTEVLQVPVKGATAIFSGQFGIKEKDSGRKARSIRSLTSGWARSAAAQELFSGDSRRADCEKYIGPKTQPVPGEQVYKKISVGELAFGPYAQSEVLSIRENQDLDYVAKLDPDLPPGLYSIFSAGSEHANPFEMVLSFPEEVRALRISGRPFGDSAADFVHGGDLDLAWKQPAIGNHRNGVMLSVALEQANNVYIVSCALFEENIPNVSGEKHWSLSKNWFAEFPKTGTLSLLLSRVHQLQVAPKGREFFAQGMRSFFTLLPIKS